MSIAKKLKKLRNPERLWRRLHEHVLNWWNWIMFLLPRSRYRFWPYSAYWIYRIHNFTNYLFIKKPSISAKNRTRRYITIIPSQSAGIGHQLANWNTAMIFAMKFNLQIVHYPFSKGWEDFLGFGEGEVKYPEIISDRSIKKVKIPRINCNHDRRHCWIWKNDIYGNLLVKNIINHIYPNNNILFHLAADQNVYDQTPVADILRKKYWKTRKKYPIDFLLNSERLNIAVHIRRGDVLTWKIKKISNWEERWLDNSYFMTILDKLTKILNINLIDVHIYSEGKMEDFLEFTHLPNINFHLNENDFKTFHSMVISDILVTSPSSFSYKAGLISNAIKIAKYPWWHYIPDNSEWIRCDAKGNFDTSALLTRFSDFTKPTH